LRDSDRHPLVLGYAFIEQSPFLFLLINKPREQVAAWHTVRRELLLFFGVSTILILSVISWGSGLMVKRIREADVKRAVVLHQAEYTNKMATIGRLAAGVAHEINNPLAIISEKAGLLQDLMQMEGQLPPRDKVLGLADSVLASAVRASRVTHRLLGFARQVDIHREVIHLEDLIQEVIGFLGREAAYRNIQMTVRQELDVPPIEGDKGQLQQVFLNVLNNALAAVKDDSGRIEIALLRSGEHHVAVTITDNGSGIEPENLSRIFEPFFTTKKGYGTGLGLSVTYGIVAKLGGNITVDSRLGEWTTFKVTLPGKPKTRAGVSDEQD
jgi:signal transduction histidine kinase